MRRIKWCLVMFGIAATSPMSIAAQRVAAPTGVTVAIDGTNLVVSWTNMSNVSSYTVNRRSPEQILGSNITASPFVTPIPTPGVAYEYQVVSIGKGKNNIAGSTWFGFTVPTSSTSTGVIVTEPRPTGTITVVPAGPSSLVAASNIPGQIRLTWKEVPNATAYRIMRSSTAPEAEAKIAELSSTSQLAEGGMWYHTDAPVDLRWTYSYKVYALFGTTSSTPSPVASAQSIRVIQPTGLRYGVTLASTPGQVNVTLSWDAVPNVATYVITGTDFAGMPTITVAANSYTLRNVPAGHTYRVCVGAVYPYSIGDPASAPCIDIKLQ